MGTQGTQGDTGDTRNTGGHRGHKGQNWAQGTPGDTKDTIGHETQLDTWDTGGHRGHKGTQWDTGNTEIMPFRIISVLFILGHFFEINRNFTMAVLTLHMVITSSEVLSLSTFLTPPNQ